MLTVRLLRWSDKCVVTSVYRLTAVTEVAMLIWNWKLTDPLPHQTLHRLKLSFSYSGHKDFLIGFHHLMTSLLV
jgi:hypothetical protein